MRNSRRTKSSTSSGQTQTNFMGFYSSSLEKEAMRKKQSIKSLRALKHLELVNEARYSDACKDRQSLKVDESPPCLSCGGLLNEVFPAGSLSTQDGGSDPDLVSGNCFKCGNFVLLQRKSGSLALFQVRSQASKAEKAFFRPDVSPLSILQAQTQFQELCKEELSEWRLKFNLNDQYLKFRSKTIKCLLGAAEDFGFGNQTAHLAIALFDSVMSRQQDQIDRFRRSHSSCKSLTSSQICTFIASVVFQLSAKYSEIEYPLVEDVCSLMRCPATFGEFIKMEQILLERYFEWDLCSVVTLPEVLETLLSQGVVFSSDNFARGIEDRNLKCFKDFQSQARSEILKKVRDLAEVNLPNQVVKEADLILSYPPFFLAVAIIIEARYQIGFEVLWPIELDFLIFGYDPSGKYLSPITSTFESSASFQMKLAIFQVFLEVHHRLHGELILSMNIITPSPSFFSEEAEACVQGFKPIRLAKPPFGDPTKQDEAETRGEHDEAARKIEAAIEVVCSQRKEREFAFSGHDKSKEREVHIGTNSRKNNNSSQVSIDLFTPSENSSGRAGLASPLRMHSRSQVHPVPKLRLQEVKANPDKKDQFSFGRRSSKAANGKLGKPKTVRISISRKTRPRVASNGGTHSKSIDSLPQAKAVSLKKSSKSFLCGEKQSGRVSAFRPTEEEKNSLADLCTITEANLEASFDLNIIQPATFHLVAPPGPEQGERYRSLDQKPLELSMFERMVNQRIQDRKMEEKVLKKARPAKSFKEAPQARLPKTKYLTAREATTNGKRGEVQEDGKTLRQRAVEAGEVRKMAGLKKTSLVLPSERNPKGKVGEESLPTARSTASKTNRGYQTSRSIPKLSDRLPRLANPSVKSNLRVKPQGEKILGTTISASFNSGISKARNTTSKLAVAEKKQPKNEEKPAKKGIIQARPSHRSGQFSIIPSLPKQLRSMSRCSSYMLEKRPASSRSRPELDDIKPKEDFMIKRSSIGPFDAGSLLASQQTRDLPQLGTISEARRSSISRPPLLSVLPPSTKGKQQVSSKRRGAQSPNSKPPLVGSRKMKINLPVASKKVKPGGTIRGQDENRFPSQRRVQRPATTRGRPEISASSIFRASEPRQ